MIRHVCACEFIGNVQHTHNLCLYESISLDNNAPWSYTNICGKNEGCSVAERRWNHMFVYNDAHDYDDCLFGNMTEATEEK